ncbi:MAG: bifunctional adenosylcobinamide kinase/adenosylcobinamide-phosphate guanylyltransferase, partial [Deltaproteobacteria bacterium]|nr:bifunctional adenosylcobinamide kinase/adenosylcobinamide-phosphate guanylyltransferase [Deltaproteobacteria bacterium]
PDNRDFGLVLARLEPFLAAAAMRSGPAIIVSNEVGCGLVPMDPVSRFFRDISGLAHQRVASVASSVFMVTAGLQLRLK